MAARIVVGGALALGFGIATLVSRRRSKQGVETFSAAPCVTAVQPIVEDARCSTSGLTFEQARVIINNRASITSHIVERRNLLYKRGGLQLLGYGAIVLGALFIHFGVALAMLLTCALLFHYTFLEHALAQMRQAKDMEGSFDDAERMVNARTKATLQRLAGTWKKDSRASDSMARAMDIMQVNPFVRKAIILMTGLRLKQSAGDFELQVLTIVPGFKVVERYAIDGSPTYWKRRDLRRGKHEGRATLLPDGSVQLRLVWPEPFSGEGEDQYCLKDPDTLHVTQTLRSRGQATSYTTVYRRRS